MSLFFHEEFSARLIDRSRFAIIGGMPPRDPEDDEDEEADDEDEGADEPPVVREPDED